jgi:hypothetical protein
MREYAADREHIREVEALYKAMKRVPLQKANRR